MARRDQRGNPADPTRSDNWSGGHYRLTIALGAPDDDRLTAGLRALWSAARLTKALDPRGSLVAQPAEALSGPELLGRGLSSVARVPGLGQCVCLVSAAREPSEADLRPLPPGDWIGVDLPMGALSELHPDVGGYPYGEGSTRRWREPIETWYAALAQGVHAVAPIELAATGFEIDGSLVADEIAGGSVREGVMRPGTGGALVQQPIRAW